MGSMGPRPPIRASWWNQAALQPSHARPPNQPRPSTSKPNLVGLVAWQDSMTSLEATLTIQALPPAIPCTSTEPGPQLGPGSIQLSRRCCWKGRRIAVACASREQETCLKNTACTLLQLNAAPSALVLFPRDLSQATKLQGGNPHILGLTLTHTFCKTRATSASVV